MKNSLKKYYGIFALPTTIAFIIAFALPFVMGIYLSLTSFTTIDNSRFTGLENYKTALGDPQFISCLQFTVKFTLVSVILVNTIAFSLALLLTKNIKGRNIFRTIFFMPNLIGGIILGYIWQLIINGILGFFGVTITFSAKYGFWGLVALTSWQMIGYMMIIYIAGISNIPSELIDAARVDGASSVGILRHVIIPMVMPSVTICLFMTITNSFKLFDANLALTDGAPSGETAMVALDIYKTFYGSIGSQGAGQAKAVLFFLLLAIISLIQLKLTRKKEVEA